MGYFISVGRFEGLKWVSVLAAGKSGGEARLFVYAGVRLKFSAAIQNALPLIYRYKSEHSAKLARQQFILKKVLAKLGDRHGGYPDITTTTVNVVYGADDTASIPGAADGASASEAKVASNVLTP